MKTELYIAIADDHELYRKGLCDFFHSFGCIIVADTSTGEELIQALERAAQLPDFCVLDAYMPGMGGLEAGKIIRKRWPDIKIVASSMRQDTALERQFTKAGIRILLPKGDHEKLKSLALRAMSNTRSKAGLF